MDIREYFQKEQKGFYAIIEKTLTAERRKQLYDAINDWHERELKLSVVKHSYKSLAEIEIGEFIEAVAIYEQSSKCLTQGKKYEVVNTEGDRYFKYIWIVDDNGKRKRYNSRNRMFKAVI